MSRFAIGVVFAVAVLMSTGAMPAAEARPAAPEADLRHAGARGFVLHVERSANVTL